ncbi:prepilin-type N-terminal cleavage/methylation domain-containing protein [Virgibacillus tibetensis]
MFEFDVLYIQSLSTTTEEFVRITFYADHYIVLRGSKEQLAVRSYPPGWKVDWRTDSTIVFEPNGTIKQPRTIQMVSPNNAYDIIFPFGKSRSILLKNSGFTLIEVLIASSLLMMIVTTIVPLLSLLSYERTILGERRAVSYQLHDELQDYIWGENETIPFSSIETIDEKEVLFEFKMENEFVKGCAKWENVKKFNEKICLYALLPK